MRACECDGHFANAPDNLRLADRPAKMVNLLQRAEQAIIAPTHGSDLWHPTWSLRNRIAAGAGGMGEVYRARDTRLERTVAIKVLNAQLVASTELRARFEREAKVISQLQHPNICVLHDVGNEGAIDYLVMEFLQGESLADRLRQGRSEEHTS